MKALFISSNLLSNKSGGWQCSNRNYESVKELCAETHVYNLSANNNLGYKAIIVGLLNLIKLYSGGLNQNHIIDVLLKIKSENYDLVFLDSSVYGRLAKKIKKMYPNVKLIAFYHNVEFDFIKKIVYTGGILHAFRLPSCFFNESLTAKWSDKIICLTNEDEKLINILYTKKEIIKIPVSFKSMRQNLNSYDKIDNNLISILFVGSYFYANTQGILWFINNVKLSPNVRLVIVGKEMEKLRTFISKTENVEIHNSVEDLSCFYEGANAVICPLFYGGGMKVKVAEALMYGKKIIGTNLAFFGYQAENCSSMITTSKPEVFKKIIEDLDPNIRTYNNSISHFEKYFSYSSTLKLFSKVLIQE
ncbi:glycosyltransferase [Flavobacterium sp. LT1R49]|uniref:glycosyltransferase n=1 Tax=Flavobacterium arabinosi TaxID=3398737 RepID=UPI003A83563F